MTLYYFFSTTVVPPDGTCTAFKLQSFHRSPSCLQIVVILWSGKMRLSSAVPLGFRSPRSSGRDLCRRCRRDEANSKMANWTSLICRYKTQETTPVKHPTSEGSRLELQSWSYALQVNTLASLSREWKRFQGSPSARSYKPVLLLSCGG